MLQRGEMTKIEAITRYDVRRGTLVRWLKRRRAEMADVDIICLRIAAELRGQKSCL